MKVSNCKLSRLQIDEADLGRQMSPEVLAHLRACHECELFLEERLKLRQLVGGLGAVEAPPDFNVRLRARLANVTAERRRSLLPVSFSLSVPSAVVAVLLLLIGLGVGVRLLSGDKEAGPVASNTPADSDSRPNPAEPTNSGQENSADLVIGAKQPEAVVAHPAPATAVKKTIPTEIRPRTAVKDFSNTAAPVFRREDSIASANELPIFPIGANYQSLLVSLDDGSGKPRTISLPSVSFGSQRVLKPELDKSANETKGIW